MQEIYENENSNKFTEIFSENWGRFKSAFPAYDNPHVNRQIQLILNCSDPQFGFKQYMCTGCGLESKVVANSCKSKFCLRCGRVDGENFSKNIADKLHEDVDHCHLVLTIPPQFRKVFYKNRHSSDLFNVFYSAGWDFVNKLMAKIFGEEVECGCLIVLHTVGRKCDSKPHLHVLLMSGGINAAGEWVVLKNFYYGIIQRL